MISNIGIFATYLNVNGLLIRYFCRVLIDHVVYCLPPNYLFTIKVRLLNLIAESLFGGNDFTSHKDCTN